MTYFGIIGEKKLFVSILAFFALYGQPQSYVLRTTKQSQYTGIDN